MMERGESLYLETKNLPLVGSRSMSLCVPGPGAYLKVSLDSMKSTGLGRAVKLKFLCFFLSFSYLINRKILLLDQVLSASAGSGRIYLVFYLGQCQSFCLWLCPPRQRT